MAVDALEKARSGLPPVRRSQQRQERVPVQRPRSLEERERQAGGGLGNQAHGPVHDGVTHKPFAGEGRRVARRPRGQPAAPERDGGAEGRRQRRGLALAPEPAKESVAHEAAPDMKKARRGAGPLRKMV
jgi:hypothetical protein